MLNSAEHEICPANKSQITVSAKAFLLKSLSTNISLLINMKMPTNVGIFIFTSRENFMLKLVLSMKKFYNLRTRLWFLAPGK